MQRLWHHKDVKIISSIK